MARVTQDRSRIVLAVTTAMISCATVFVALRLVSRIGIVKKIMVDDYFIILAWLISFGLSFSICDATHYGLGRHEDDVPTSHQGSLNRLDYTFTALYNPALMATKTSILVFFLTLSKQQRVFTWTVWATLAVVNAAGLALSFLNIFQCRPLSATFDESRPADAHCTDIVTLFLSSAPVNIITDIVILLLPMPILKSMRLPRKQKWILYITFGFGIFVAVVDVVRISYLQNAAVTRAEGVINGQGADHSRQTEQTSDFSWYAAYIFMWSAIEVNVGIMVACVPALKPLVSRFMPQLIRDKIRSGSGKRDSNTTPKPTDTTAAQRVPQSIYPPQAAHHAPNDVSFRVEPELSMPEFLTTPDMTEIPQEIERADTSMTNASITARRGTATDFDFVSMTRFKCIVYLSNRESFRPVAEVTFLFFLWGFAYGLLNALNGQIQAVTKESANQAIGTHSAYYVGYFIAPLSFGRLVLKNWGFKACYIIGLMIYGTGTLIFWPAAVLTSWPAFLVTNFIIGLGLSVLELAANPFIALCGPADFAEVRLNLSQGFQACGTVFATALAKKVLFNDVHDAASLIDVQWTYLAISLFAFVLAFVYYAVKLPEVTDDELEDAAEQCFPENLHELRKSRITWATLGLAVFSLFCYVGAQESLATSLDAFVGFVQPGADTVNYEVVAQTFFAVSRFISALAGIFTTPRIHLAFFFIGAILFSALAMKFQGFTACCMVICVFFFEGPLFSIIYAMPLRCLGKYTKDSSALLAAAISGGSFFPAIMHTISARKSHPNGVQYSMCVAIAAFAFGAIFPMYANAVPRARQSVDPPRKYRKSYNEDRSSLASIGRQLESTTSKKSRKSTAFTGEGKLKDPIIGDSGSSEEPNAPNDDGARSDEKSIRPPERQRGSVGQDTESPATPVVMDFATAHIRNST